MNVTKSTDQIAQVLSDALAERRRSVYIKPAPEDNPLAGQDITALMHGVGVRTSADQHPAVLKPGLAMEQARLAGLRAGQIDRSAKRMAASRARAERKAQFDAIAAIPLRPGRERLTQAWEVVTPLTPVITRGAKAKHAWASRFLGSSADDLPSMVIESTVLVLAKSDKDLDLLARAACELGQQLRDTGRMPGEQMSEEERKERREMARARKWLMGLVNNRLMGALVDSYTSQRNLRWDNIDLIATVMASITGPEDDPFIKRHKADRAPAFLGTRFPAPGRLDANLLATTIGAAITERGLDPLVELLLDTERVRTDGAFSWAEYAEEVFALSPTNGAEVWSLVYRATEHLLNPRRARADAARTHVRHLFEWLPGLVVSAVQAFDFEVVAHSTFCQHQTAMLASQFEQHVHGERGLARPALVYASPAEAAQAITEHLAILVSGQDLVASMVFA